MTVSIQEIAHLINSIDKIVPTLSKVDTDNLRARLSLNAHDSNLSEIVEEATVKVNDARNLFISVRDALYSKGKELAKERISHQAMSEELEKEIQRDLT